MKVLNPTNTKKNCHVYVKGTFTAEEKSSHDSAQTEPWTVHGDLSWTHLEKCDVRVFWAAIN